jgi:hypothetical protein
MAASVRNRRFAQSTLHGRIASFWMVSGFLDDFPAAP